MRATFLSTVATIILTASTALAQSEGEFPAKLAGHVVMPAATFIDAPADAPRRSQDLRQIHHRQARRRARHRDGQVL